MNLVLSHTDPANLGVSGGAYTTIEILIDAAILLIALGALIVSAIAARRQAQASTFGSYLNVAERLAGAWRRYRHASESDKDFEFTEILNLLESVSHLYYSRSIYGATREMIRNHLSKVLPIILRNKHARKKIQEEMKDPQTFKYIQEFAQEHDIKLQPSDDVTSENLIDSGNSNRKS